jgi:opacity protein-like surface antigen
MKKIIISVVLALSMTPAYADVYVKVDAQGNAISGAIVCDAETCGAGSEYSRLTLNEGEQYVLQGYGHSGIGNNNPNTTVKVDIPNQVWTVTNETTQTIEQKFTPQEVLYQKPYVPIETTTVVTDTATAIIDTATALSDIDFNSSDWFNQIMAWLNNFIMQFYAVWEGLHK